MQSVQQEHRILQYTAACIMSFIASEVIGISNRMLQKAHNEDIWNLILVSSKCIKMWRRRTLRQLSVSTAALPTE